MLGYSPADIISMPFDKRDFIKRYESMIFRTFIPSQVKNHREPNYTSVFTYHHKFLDDYIALYDAFALTVRYFNSLEREKRNALYKQQRKLLKRAHHKDKLSNSLKVS